MYKSISKMLSDILSALSILSCALGTSAAPAAANDVTSGTSFSVEAVRNLNYSVHPTSALLQLYAKYSLVADEKVSEEFRSALNQRRDGSVQVTTVDSQYLVPISIGGQQRKVAFDTASDDLWVFTGWRLVGDLKYYDPTKSKTFENKTDLSWEVTFADNNKVSGYVGEDTLVIGGMTVPKQPIEFATYVQGNIMVAEPDGYLGLGLGTRNNVLPEAQATFFQMLQPSLTNKLFTAYLPLRGKPSYEFGKIDPGKHTGEIQYAGVYGEDGFWEVDSERSHVNDHANHQIDRLNPDPNPEDNPVTRSIMDINAAFLLMVGNVTALYYEKVPGATYQMASSMWVYPCKTDLPSFTLQIGSYFATIPGKVLTGRYVSRGTCSGRLQPAPDTSIKNIIGAPFFNSHLAVFDYQYNLFGFAPFPDDVV